MSHYDVIIVGTGAGGGTLAYKLAPSGKKILVLEQGDFLPHEPENWQPRAVLSKKRYANAETWRDRHGKPIHPVTYYYVGGNTKFYGAALLRMRDRDFEQVIHEDGISPAWPLKYADFAPYYDQAEILYQVRGQRGLDPTEPPCDRQYPFPPLQHEPYIQKIYEELKNQGFHPFYLPLGIQRNDTNPSTNPCIRCHTCDGFPCLKDAKADAHITCIQRALQYPNLSLLTGVKVTKLHTNATGKTVTKVEASINGNIEYFSSDIVIISCGAINSAALLLRSATSLHPKGLANSSDLVGRNYMAHKYGIAMTLSTQANPTTFNKTLGCTDFYWGEPDFPYPMGSVQLLGKIHPEHITANSPVPSLPFVAKQLAHHSLGWLLITEDLPDPKNRIRIVDNQIQLDYHPNNQTAFNRLKQRWLEVLKSINSHPYSTYLVQDTTIKEVGHMCGTCRFGENPQTSVLNLDCRTHDIENLYVVDGSFFPSSSAVNPTLTIIANALRVGDRLLGRLNN